jgi:uncharacterized membrane protein YccC
MENEGKKRREKKKIKESSQLTAHSSQLTAHSRPRQRRQSRREQHPQQSTALLSAGREEISDKSCAYHTVSIDQEIPGIQTSSAGGKNF